MKYKSLHLNLTKFAAASDGLKQKAIAQLCKDLDDCYAVHSEVIIYDVELFDQTGADLDRLMLVLAEVEKIMGKQIYPKL